MFDCDPATIVDQQIEAWRARDAAAFSSFYAPDAVIVMGPGDDDTLAGREAIQEHYANGFLEMPAGVELSIANRIVSGDYVIDEEHVRADGLADEAVVIYRVKACLIARAELLPSVQIEGEAAR